MRPHLSSGAQRLNFRSAVDEADHRAVMRLRETVYVRDQERLSNASAFESTFDTYENATYIIAAMDERDVGVVKVIADSPSGLPCDTVVDLEQLRTRGHLVEIGHLMTIPEARHHGLGVALMKAALDYAVDHGSVDIVLGDFFATPDGNMHDFYTSLGFFQVGPVYRDERFTESPWSIVGALDVREAVRRTRRSDASEAMVLLFGDLTEDRYRVAMEGGPQ